MSEEQLNGLEANQNSHDGQRVEHCERSTSNGSDGSANAFLTSESGTAENEQSTEFSVSHIPENEKVRNGEAISNVDHCSTLMMQVKIVKDRVRGVVRRTSNGLYLHGRPGTSKTHTVLSTLNILGIKPAYSNGHLTPIGLFELIAENKDRIIVLDDVSSIFNQPIALQILLAALGNHPDGTGVRYVRHKTARGDEIVPFSGGIIAISNLPLAGHHQEILRALSDRVFVIDFDPTDEQIIALMQTIAAQGIREVAPIECIRVCAFLLTQMHARGIRPSVRHLVDKAIPDYHLWKMGGTEAHWKDLVSSSLDQQLVELQHPISDISRAEQIEAERRIVADICLTTEDRSERLETWRRQTGKSQAAFYRRLKEAISQGLLLAEIVAC